MKKQIIYAKTILSMDDDFSEFSPGYIKVENGKIIDIGEGAPVSGKDEDCIDLGNKLVMPGLINTHTHTPMILFRGMAEGVSLFTMDGFLNTLRRFEAQIDETMIAHGVACSAAEMIRTGTTCFADQYFYSDVIFDEVKQSGLRGVIGYGIVELGDEVRREQELASAEDFLKKCASDKSGRVTGWVGPHAFFVDNSEELIKREIELARKYNVGFHIHFATSNEENDYCRPRFGKSAVQKMEELGILNIPILAAHSITVSEEDLQILSNYPFYPVMAPSAAMRSGFPAAPVLSMLQKGIPVSLGTDNVCNSNSYDMFSEMSTGAKLIIHREQDAAAVTPRDIVAMSTRNAAKALGMDSKIGSLEKGKNADFISLDLDAYGWEPFEGQDFYTQIVYSIHGTDVCDVFVDGANLMKDKKVLTVDYSARAQGMAQNRRLLLTRLS